MDTLLAGWENFYVIVGTSAGGLTGLTFVVIALVKDAGRVTPAGLGAFITPTIVHFGGVLAMSAFLSMPHQHVPTLSVGFGLAGLAGLIYTGRIAAAMRGQAHNYAPVWEDWIFNAMLPGIVYGALLVAAATIRLWPSATLFAIAAASLVMLFVGIHNAWDIAVWMTTRTPRDTKK